VRDLTGKTALVTGAASGIGLGIAGALAEAGMHLVLADLRAEPLEQARALVAKLGAAKGGRVVCVVTDVTDHASVAAAGRAAEQAFGKLHVLVNNAGIAMHGIPVEQATAETWRRVIDVNVMGVIHGIHALLPLIRRHGEGGHVVNTASISGFFVREGRNQGGYAMTKYAVVALSEALEQETKGSGIGVSVLCPGPVRTEFFTAPPPADGATPPPRADGVTPSARADGATPPRFTGHIEPEAVGARVLHAIRHDEFYIFTHTNERAVVQARHARIAAAFDRADALARGEPD
jgi:NAD(P)-dependent dehydrogenase (short-subunit alcohol dehydrogenase family)